VGKVKKAGAARNSRKKPAKRAANRATGARKAKRHAPPSSATMYTVRELDPIRKCGPGTSVQLLYRVDEALGKVVRSHLVFFDRHGWYCEHGPGCVAVKDVHKELKDRARAARR